MNHLKVRSDKQLQSAGILKHKQLESVNQAMRCEGAESPKGEEVGKMMDGKMIRNRQGHRIR